MKDLNEIKNDHLDLWLQVKTIENKISQKEKQIARLNKKREKLSEKCWWGTSMIRPIMELVKARFPQIVWDDDRLTPMGLCNRVSLFGRVDGNEENNLIILCFTPSDTRNAMIAYDTEERTGEYPPNSIGAMNDMNKVSEDLTDMEQIYKLIEKQLNEK